MPYLPKHAHEAIRSAAQGYTWPGSYPLFAVMADRKSLCPDCLRENLKLIVQATHDHEVNPPGFDPQWAVVACEVNWEDGRRYCVNCYNHIPSAYGEPEDGALCGLKAIAMPLSEEDDQQPRNDRLSLSCPVVPNLKITRPGHYLCRDGRLAYVNAVGRTSCKGFIYGTWRTWELWNLRGQVDQMQESPRDLIGEHHE